MRNDINTVVPSSSSAGTQLSDAQLGALQKLKDCKQDMRAILDAIDMVKKKRPDDREEIERQKQMLRYKYEMFILAAQSVERTLPSDPERTATIQKLEKEMARFLGIKKTEMKVGSQRQRT